MQLKNILIFLAVILGGAVLGNFIGKLLVIAFPSGGINDLFSTGLSMGFEPTRLDLIIANLTLGFKLKLNVTGIIGIVFTAFLARKIIK